MVLKDVEEHLKFSLEKDLKEQAEEILVCCKNILGCSVRAQETRVLVEIGTTEIISPILLRTVSPWLHYTPARNWAL